MSEYPEPMRRIEYMLKTYGGWNWRFGQTWISREQDIIAREGNPGFWTEWAIAKGQEYFREEVTACVRELRRMGDTRDKDKLSDMVERALKLERWKPPITKIKKQIAELKQSKRAEIQELREYVRAIKLERKKEKDNGKEEC